MGTAGYGRGGWRIRAQATVRMNTSFACFRKRRGVHLGRLERRARFASRWTHSCSPASTPKATLPTSTSSIWRQAGLIEGSGPLHSPLLFPSRCPQTVSVQAIEVGLGDRRYLSTKAFWRLSWWRVGLGASFLFLFCHLFLSTKAFWRLSRWRVGRGASSFG